MENLKKQYNLLQINNVDFQINIQVVKNLPEIKIYLKNHGKYYGIFDGGTTLSVLLVNRLKQDFEKKLYEICKKRKVSKNGNVLFLETYEKDFANRLNDFILALNEISKL
jgi:uncharacterized alpha/beta hydrolase family protein